MWSFDLTSKLKGREKASGRLCDGGWLFPAVLAGVALWTAAWMSIAALMGMSL